MPIISKTGRNSLNVKLLIWSFYAILMLGSVTMLYPFMLMVSGTTKSSIDTPDSAMVPTFLYNEEALYRKDTEAFFNESLQMMQAVYDTGAGSFRHIALPGKGNEKFVSEWQEFLSKNALPFYFYSAAYLRAPVSKRVMPLALRNFKSMLYAKCGGDIDKLNREYGTEFMDWNTFYIDAESYLQRRERPGNSLFDKSFRAFKGSLPLEDRCYFSPEGFYKAAFLFSQYSKNIDAYNKTHGTSFASWTEVKLSRSYPDSASRLERSDWESFTRYILNLYWLRAAPEAAPLYRAYLQDKYETIEALNKNYISSYKSFNEVPLVEAPPENGIALSDWDSFVQGWKSPDTGKLHMLPGRMMRVHSIEFLFRDYLAEKYKTVAAANAALGTTFSNWMDAFPPQKEFNYEVFKNRTGPLKWEYVKRNYITVSDYIILHGRGLMNTVIYCALSILIALIVNPLAAYALSRYNPPSTYKVLLFLMLTMAFPPMVTQIPVFLMLREFDMLNTFWALILPGMANGYSIFLLKGFFDSLPRELYESAELDGAGEIRIFLQITMSLSTPILAVIALNAFTQAYSNFMMALLICQDRDMWTLMPWLYQLQMGSCQGVVFAALLIAAIPTFIIFACCQNIIMRGIVVPVEK